nr:stage III sporulation protein AA [Natranaerovirga hydrolytica]
MDQRTSILKIFSLNIREILQKALTIDFNYLQEIRLRINAPLMIIYKNREIFITNQGDFSYTCKNAFIVNKKEIKETIEYISNYSLYAFEEDIKQGFITIEGGHRIGLAGKVIVEQGRVKNIKHISFINIRISHEIKGCANGVIHNIIDEDNLYHTMIISPPRCGKTTLLRDIIRQVSNGEHTLTPKTIGVVDERSEIGACYNGIPQNDLGIRTDVLDCCPKVEGMLMLIRSMSPQVIAVDELGSDVDIKAIEYVINSGCKLICTVHGQSIDDVKQKPLLDKLVANKIFERYIILSNKKTIGEITDIYNQKLEKIQ